MRFALIRAFFLLVLTFISQAITAQVRVSGKVTDEATGQSLPYVSVRVPNTAAGTTSNIEGEFELNVPAQARQIIFSQLGYLTDTLHVESGRQLSVKLRPAPIMLPEVKVPNYVESLLARAYRVLLRNNNIHNYGQAFYRQTTRLDGEATEVQEQVWKVETSNVGVVGTILVQGRYAVKKSLINFHNFSVNTRGNINFATDADSTETKALISPNAGKYYTLTLIGIEQRGQQQVAEIGFVKKNNTFAGSIMIDVATGQLLRLKGDITNFNSTFGDSAPNLQNGVMTFECAFLPGDRAPNLNYIKTTYTATVTRKMKTSLPLLVSAFAYFYGAQPKPAPGVTYEKIDLNKGADLAEIKQTTYDPAFWENNSVVKRTPLEEEVIKSFERGKAFGTMLPKK